MLLLLLLLLLLAAGDYPPYHLTLHGACTGLVIHHVFMRDL
jgi:hypothetical protein